jgi:pyridoxal phosphate enzyme (YggS family)
MTDPSLRGRIEAGLAAVHERIRTAGGDPSRVQVLAVTKGQPVEVIEAARAAGLVDFGESYVQELEAKASAIEGSPASGERPWPRWHMIGHLQTNKVRRAAPHVHLWQSVDRLSLAAEIARRAPGAAVLVQVNVSGQPQQGGCAPERVAATVDGCRDLGLDVRGLMAIGAQGPATTVSAGFEEISRLADGFGLVERSMGMSGDLELAVAAGATMVRVGTALFGPRGERLSVGK